MDTPGVKIQPQKREVITDRFLPIYLQTLWIDSVPDFDLYIYQNQEMILYRAANVQFTEKVRLSLQENGIQRLYVSTDNRREYQKYLHTYMSHILADPSLNDFAKSSIVYDSAKEVIKEVLSNPTYGENIKHCQAMVESTALYILEGKNAFHNLLRIMSFDYTVYNHSVNVYTFSLALAQAAGIHTTRALIELGTGALLHDVGKVKISESILNKPGPLDAKEWAAVKCHPRLGVELIRETDLIPENSYIPIGQHHERQDGSGYPDGIAGGDIHPFGKIVAIADMFDAMTTGRVYRSAVSGFTALRSMYDEQETLDQDLLNKFTILMGPTPLGEL